MVSFVLAQLQANCCKFAQSAYAALCWPLKLSRNTQSSILRTSRGVAPPPWPAPVLPLIVEFSILTVALEALTYNPPPWPAELLSLT